MKRLHFVVSLMTDKNAYQKDQALAAQAAGGRLGSHVKILFADGDAVMQSEQLLKIIQSSTEETRPDGIVCQPVGTTLERVAREAASRGIGWALLNREGDYITELRNQHRVPAFIMALDQEEIGRIQGRQFGALLPRGGTVMYITGPSTNAVFKQRHSGMQAMKPANIQVITLRGNLTSQSAYDAVNSWLRLHTSRAAKVDLVAGQNDEMAMGARQAFEETLTGEVQERWLSLPYTGCDASSGAGADWIRHGHLTASVYLPATAGMAVETLARAIQGKTLPPPRHQIAPVSRPSLEALAEIAGKKEALVR